jgi:hypothetical protein
MFHLLLRRQSALHVRVDQVEVAVTVAIAVAAAVVTVVANYS